jgi:hypothetical protein
LRAYETLEEKLRREEQERQELAVQKRLEDAAYKTLRISENDSPETISKVYKRLSTVLSSANELKLTISRHKITS